MMGLFDNYEHAVWLEHTEVVSSNRFPIVIQQYHCTAALSSSADAPIIWSRANGSIIVKKLPKPRVPITKPTTISTKAGIGVQSNCNITKA